MNNYPIFYYFNQNRRVYEKDGKKSLSPFYEEHFVKINIVDENDKESIDRYGNTINKRSMLYKINSTTRVTIFTEQQKEDNIFVTKEARKLSEMVRKLDANSLRKVEELLINLGKNS